MNRTRLLSFATVLLTIPLLAACSTTSPDPDPDPDPEPEVQSYDVLVHDPGNANPFIITFLMASPSALVTATPLTGSPDEIAPTSLSEIDDGLFVGNASNVDEANRSSLIIPAEEDVPTAVMVPVGQAFSIVNETADCEVQADDGTADVSFNYYSEILVPGPLGFAGTPLLALASDEEINLDTYGTVRTRLYTWLYSDSDVSLTFEGAGCGDLSADLDLVEGWNTLLLDINPDAPAVTLENVDEPEMLHITVAPPGLTAADFGPALR